MRLKHSLSGALFAVLLCVLMAGCAFMRVPSAASENELPEHSSAVGAEKTGEVIILYTNDIHTYIDNTRQNAEGEVIPGLTYASVAAMRQELESEGKNVLLVDAGDHSQGTAYGAMDLGATAIRLMNAAGYQLATPGNHEFDYGRDCAFYNMEMAAFPYISCNFYNASTGELVLPAYKIFEVGGIRIAFIGISTPETLSKSTPSYFKDENGEFLYGFYAGEDGAALYASVQNAIDEVRGSVDYIIALGHTGVDLSSEPYTSTSIISHVEGLDAYIDGHSHTTMESEAVCDKAGNKVILTQTGCYLNAIGKMTISGESITAELITEYNTTDVAVAEIAEQWKEKVDVILGGQVAVLDGTMYIFDAEDPGVRVVRRRETNLGDLTADAMYYYFNNVLELSCDGAISNGGGIRTQLDAGPFSYRSAKDVQPFGNVVCMVEMRGSQLLDVLEKGVMKLGLYEPETGREAESGGFMQVAGICYTVDTSIDSTVRVDENKNWVSGPAGEYRVTQVQIYNRELGQYEPLEPERTYRIAGSNYLLRNQGDGLTMLADTRCVQDYVGEDYMLLAQYAGAFAPGVDGVPHICTEGSPLAALNGYLINYESPQGAGRITVR